MTHNSFAVNIVMSKLDKRAQAV